MNNESLLFEFGMSFIYGLRRELELVNGEVNEYNFRYECNLQADFWYAECKFVSFLPKTNSDYVPQSSILWLKAPAGKFLVDIHDIDDKIRFMFYVL